MPTSVPQVLGPYQLSARLAVGGQSEVWLARRVGPGGFQRRCALKLLLPPDSLDEAARKAFVAEARLVAQFDHPNLIAVTDLGEERDSNVFYAAMPYVSGKSLATLLREKELDFDVSHGLWLIAQVLRGLDFAHKLSDERGRRLDVIHRDVSPENIMVGFDGGIKLIDFGIALSSINPRNTKMHVVKGKLDFLSPEQASASPKIDQTTDIYSAGLLLYWLLTGVNPLAGDPDTALERARNPRITRVSNHVRVPESLVKIVHSMLDPVAANRPQDAYELARELLNVLHDIRPKFDELDLKEWLHEELRDEMRRERDFLQGLAEGTQVIETTALKEARKKSPSGDDPSSGKPKKSRRDETTPILDARELVKTPPTPPSATKRSGPRSGKGDDGLEDIFRELEEIYDD